MATGCSRKDIDKSTHIQLIQKNKNDLKNCRTRDLYKYMNYMYSFISTYMIF